MSNPTSFESGTAPPDTIIRFREGPRAAPNRLTTLDTVLAQSPIGIVVVDMAGRVTACNPSFTRLFRYEEPELSGARLDAVIPARPAEAGPRAGDTPTAADAPGPTMLARRRDGVYIEVEIQAVPLFACGARYGTLAFYRDMGELKAARAEVAHFFTQMLSLVCVVGLDGYFRRLNPMWEKTLGIPTEAILRQPFMNLVHPHDVAASRAQVAHMGGGSTIAFENRMRCADGSYKWILWNATPLPNGSEFLATGCDITERKIAEQALREAHMETEQLLGSISSVLIGVDAHGCVTRWNSAAARAFGLTAESVIGRPLAQCGIRWLDPFAVDRLQQSVEPGEAVRLDDLRFTDSDGAERVVGLTVTSLQREGSARGGCVILGADVTERRLLESQLRLAQKLEAIGQLAASIAHDINTPIQYVGDNLRFLQDSWGNLTRLLDACGRLKPGRNTAIPPDLTLELLSAARTADLDFVRREIPSAITQSLEGMARVRRIVRAMQEFSHPGGEERTDIDINHAIATTLIVAHNETKYIADVVTDFDSSLPLVPCLLGEFNQVILNLLMNAVHAIADNPRPDGQKGTVRFVTRGLEDSVEIQVSDTGGGIPESIRDRVFEPFFTTKKVGKGTGQGLAIAHRLIVSKHGGDIWFQSEVGKGTTFYIRLPRTSSR
jgi:PAS domain S-box-containing protein